MRFLLLTAMSALVLCAGDLEKARDAQDRAALEQNVRALYDKAAKQPSDADTQYRYALAQSYVAEVAIEQKDKRAARSSAELGIKAAEKAVSLKPASAEYHRILGTLCGQVIPANIIAGMSYGKCALDEVNKAISLDPKSALAYLSRGVGNYYLPTQFGGGVEKAVADFQKAASMDPKLAEAQLWLGLGLRKLNRNPEARKAFETSLQLNPNRIWAKQQLEKTPVR